MQLLIVAAGAVLVFVGVKAKELWDRDRPRRSRGAIRVDEPIQAPRPRWSAPTYPILALALLSTACGAIHSAVSAEHFQEAFIYGVFFLASSTMQTGWAVLLVYRPNRTLLIVGAFGNAATIVLWTLTRTVGLPFGPQPWRPEAVGVLALVSTVLELAIVLGAATLVARRTTLTTPDVVARRLETVRSHYPTFMRQHDKLTSRPPGRAHQQTVWVPAPDTSRTMRGDMRGDRGRVRSQLMQE